MVETGAIDKCRIADVSNVVGKTNGCQPCAVTESIFANFGDRAGEIHAQQPGAFPETPIVDGSHGISDSAISNILGDHDMVSIVGSTTRDTKGVIAGNIKIYTIQAEVIAIRKHGQCTADHNQDQQNPLERTAFLFHNYYDVDTECWLIKCMM